MKKRTLFLCSALLLFILTMTGCGRNTQPAEVPEETESRQTVTVSTLEIDGGVSAEAASSDPAAETENKTLEEGNVVVEYPQVRDLEGGEKLQKQVNALVQADAKLCLEDEDIQKEENTGVVENTVIYHGDVLSVVSTGTVTEKDGSQQMVVYTTNVSLVTGERVSTGVRENAAAVAKKILAGEAPLLEADDDRRADQEAYLQKLGEKKLAALLERCDFTAKDKEPKAFSYYVAEDEEEVGVYLPVPAKMGSYAIVLLPAGAA